MRIWPPWGQSHLFCSLIYPRCQEQSLAHRGHSVNICWASRISEWKEASGCKFLLDDDMPCASLSTLSYIILKTATCHKYIYFPTFQIVWGTGNFCDLPKPTWLKGGRAEIWTWSVHVQLLCGSYTFLEWVLTGAACREGNSALYVNSFTNVPPLYSRALITGMHKGPSAPLLITPNKGTENPGKNPSDAQQGADFLKIVVYSHNGKVCSQEKWCSRGIYNDVENFPSEGSVETISATNQDTNLYTHCDSLLKIVLSIHKKWLEVRHQNADNGSPWWCDYGWF